ncbi:hypothetical protein FRX31_017823 [Thalictrum thalictroides]|uniref:Uncharacterized protein n=1 Tax=Thalictrum thalictroides TaxID=46969 RepID=A0A7J6W5D9_THATH|nr:hypothetical protein FRX31_017823 [Thalictrum thalictroides]
MHDVGLWASTFNCLATDSASHILIKMVLLSAQHLEILLWTASIFITFLLTKRTPIPPRRTVGIFLCQNSEVRPIKQARDWTI